MEFDTPEKCMTYLDEHNVPYEADAKHEMLMAQAQRRAKRLREDAGEVLATKKKLSDSLPMSLKEFIRSLENAKEKTPDANTGEVLVFRNVNCIIIDVERECVKLKHQIADWKGCRGYVKMGVCSGCRVQTPGVLTYAFQILVRDSAYVKTQLSIKVTENGGIALFNMSAANLNSMQLADMHTEIEKIQYVPAVLKIGAKYNAIADEWFMFVYGGDIIGFH